MADVSPVLSDPPQPDHQFSLMERVLPHLRGSQTYIHGLIADWQRRNPVQHSTPLPWEAVVVAALLRYAAW